MSRPLAREPFIGVVELASSYPKVPGNMANPHTFAFPVRYATARIRPGWWLAEEGPESSEEAFMASARELEDQGAAAITTSCGLFGVFQRRAAEELRIPVFTSPLMLIPMVARMVGGRPVGVVTAAGERLREHGFLEQSGVAADASIVIAAVDACAEFLGVIRNQTKSTLDSQLLEEQVTAQVQAMLECTPEVAALVLECSDIPPYGHRLAQVTGLPTFDFTQLTTLVYQAIVPHQFPSDRALRRRAK
jgi:hypothetical protein